MTRIGLSKNNISEDDKRVVSSVSEAEKFNIDTTVEEHINEKSVFKTKAKNITKVLFISRDETFLNPSKQSLDGGTNISNLFNEVHILILRSGIKAKNPTLRVAKNVWLYTASSKDWWRTPFAGMDLAEKQLVFANGFRPDLIIARDPFESAFLAIKLGEKYKRPVQLHIVEDYTKTEWLQKNRHNRWRKFLAHFTIPKVQSLRTNTKSMYDFIKENFSVKDLDILPRFNSCQPVITITDSIDLKSKYAPLSFLMLYVGQLTHDSGLFKVIEAGRFGLRHPHIGLIVLGDGPARRELEKKAEFFGINKQIIFETKIEDISPYIKSTDVLIVTDTNHESEEVVLRGAAMGIPMVIARTPRREDIFADGESALFCSPENIDEFSLKLNLLMKDISLRKNLAKMSQNIIKTKFHDDPGKYLMDYRNSLERVYVDEVV